MLARHQDRFRIEKHTRPQLRNFAKVDLKFKNYTENV